MNIYQIEYSGADIDSAIYHLLNDIRIIKFYHPVESGEQLEDPVAIYVGAPGTYIRWQSIIKPDDQNPRSGTIGGDDSYHYTGFKDNDSASSVAVFSSTNNYLISEDACLVGITVPTYYPVVDIIHNGVIEGPLDWNGKIQSLSDVPLELVLRPSSGYTAPSSIIVNKATCQYYIDNESSPPVGRISLTQATGSVRIKATCPTA